jgi:ABC-type branched-subunit amino acid transport system ATPase component
MAAHMTAALSTRALDKRFGLLTVAREISFELPQGARYALIGPNGAGKTTLFSLMSGEALPDTGEIRLLGHDVTRMAPHRRAALGLALTSQITNLFPRLGALDNCVLAAQALSPVKLHLHRDLARYPVVLERARRVLDAVGLADKAGAVVRDLSHGEQRQLEIALAIAGEPVVLLLDEPTAGLSPAESAMMTALLRRLDPRITLLIIEHDMDVAFQLTDRITVLHHGAVVADGTREDVTASALVQEIYLGAGDLDE